MRILTNAWRRWIKLAEILGNIQMFIILSLIYWTIFAVVAIPIKFFTDPLVLKRPDRASWISKEPVANVHEFMKRQG